MDSDDVGHPPAVEKFFDRAFIFPGADVRNNRRIEFGIDVHRKDPDVEGRSYGRSLHSLGDRGQ